MENKEQPYLQVGVKVILQREDDKVLLLRRNPRKYPEIGPKWDIVGGRIDIGFSLLENLKREVYEETGLRIIGKPKLLYAQDILNIERFPGRHVVRLTYSAKANGEPVIDGESTEYNWFSYEEIKDIQINELDRFFREVIE